MEEIGRSQFVKFLAPFEWIPQDFDKDLGEDIFIRIYDQGNATGLSLYIQHKSVQNIASHRLKAGSISFGIETKDLIHWENHDPPVFLVVWDINLEKGWWIGIDGAIKELRNIWPDWRSKKEIRVHIPSTNCLDENGLKQIRQILAERIYPLIVSGKEQTIHGKFAFPKTSQGLAKLKEFQNFIDKGDPVTIEGEYIEQFDPPPEWARLFGDIDPKEMNLAMGVLPSKPLPWRIDILGAGYERERLDWVELHVEKSGLVEMTLTNADKIFPYEITIILNHVTHIIQFTLTVQFVGMDAYLAKQGVNILKILSSGGRVELTLLKNNAKTIIPIQDGSIPPPNPESVEFIDNLYKIQKATRVELLIPELGLITYGDFINSSILVSILETGRYRPDGTLFTIELPKSTISDLVEKSPSNDIVYFRMVTENVAIELFSKQVDLGPMTRYITGKWEIPIEQARTWLAQADETSYFKAQFSILDIYEEYDNWLPHNANKASSDDHQ